MYLLSVVVSCGVDFLGRENTSYPKIPLFYPIRVIRINVNVATIVIFVITAIIAIIANIGIIVITGISDITSICRKLALFYLNRTGQPPPAGLSDVAVNTGLNHRKPGGDYRSPHKPQTFPILTWSKPHDYPPPQTPHLNIGRNCVASAQNRAHSRRRPLHIWLSVIFEFTPIFCPQKTPQKSKIRGIPAEVGLCGFADVYFRDTRECT